MTQEEKQLLLKDLCARLPYGVFVNAKSIGLDGEIFEVNVRYGMLRIAKDICTGESELVPIFDVKPYLRPMSSMTEEEEKELAKEQKKDEDLFLYIIKKSQEGDDSLLGTAIPHYAEDWANKNMFDYRGLIEKSLAIIAPEEMYK